MTTTALNTQGLQAGRQLKAEGQAAAASGASEWHERAIEVITELANDGHKFTSEDVTDRIGLPSGGTGLNENNAVGSAFSIAARKGIIEWTGKLKQSSREERHASDLRVWRKAQPGNPYLLVEADTLRRINALAAKALRTGVEDGTYDQEFAVETTEMVNEVKAILASSH